jgi:hypothetical protein
MLAASSLVIAASYWSMINGGRAVTLYRKASEVYRDMGHGYGIVLALASGTLTEIKSMLSAIDEMREPSPQTVAFAMIANEISTVGHGLRRERLLTRWRQIGNYPIGR